MKRKIICPLMLLLATSVSMPGCSSTDSTNTEVATIDKTVAEQAYDNASYTPVASDTTVSTENSGNVSASNELGRDMNMVALVQRNPELSILMDLIRAADMINVLQSPGTYTFFAPTNKAFENLPAGAVEALKRPGSKTELTNLLQAHVINKELKAADMQNNMTAETTMGENITIRRSGQSVVVGGATVISSDIDASNGVIHVIDKVLVPPKN